MKKFTVTVLSVAVFFLGLGALVEKVGAKFKSDEKALALIAQARKAIGGDEAIKGVQSLRIVGKTTRAAKMKGFDTNEAGETEIALQFPDKFMKMTKLGKDDGTGKAETFINQQVDVVTTGDAKDHMKLRIDADGGEGGAVARKIVIKKDDGTVQELTGDEAAAFIAKNHGGAPHTIMLKAKPDGTVEQTGGDGANVILRKVEGGNVTFTTTTDGKEAAPVVAHTITLKRNADGSVEQVGGGEGANIILHKVDGGSGEANVIVRRGEGGTATFITKDDKNGELGDKNVVFTRTMGDGPMTMAHGGSMMRSNDMLRSTLGLLLTAPEGMDVSYTYGGESDVDGTSCNVVVAAYAGASYKLFLSKASSLPVMMSFKGSPAPQVFSFRTKAPDGSENTNENVMTFDRKIEGGALEGAETSVKFSDYRSVNGVQLPYKWTQTVGGAADETFDVTNYEVNPANIAEKFQNQKVMVRTAKPIDK